MIPDLENPVGIFGRVDHVCFRDSRSGEIGCAEGMRPCIEENNSVKPQIDNQKAEGLGLVLKLGARLCLGRTLLERVEGKPSVGDDEPHTIPAFLDALWLGDVHEPLERRANALRKDEK